MLCDTCRTECATSVPKCGRNTYVLYYYCAMCDMYKITFKHDNSKDSILKTLRAINHIRDALAGSGWRMGTIKQPNYSGDD
jgi:hypothetical protein